jgi:hypothetical protein
MTAIRRTARAILMILAVTMLILPAVALYLTHRMSIRLALIAAFSFLFALALALGTRSRNHEIFLAVAASVLIFHFSYNGESLTRLPDIWLFLLSLSQMIHSGSTTIINRKYYCTSKVHQKLRSQHLSACVLLPLEENCAKWWRQSYFRLKSRRYHF